MLVYCRVNVDGRVMVMNCYTCSRERRGHITVNVPKFRTPKVSDKMAYTNRADPDQTAP